MSRFKSWLKKVYWIDPVLTLSTLLLGLSAYVYTTFATMAYVDGKYDSVATVLNKIDKDVSETKGSVQYIRGVVDTMKSERRNGNP